MKFTILKSNWIIVLSSLLFIILIPGCTSDDSNSIYGTWKMHKVIQGGTDVTAEHNPESDRFVIINVDGTFESGGNLFGKNTGKYTFNKEEQSLFLDSDSGPEDDSNWIVSFMGDTMHWQGFGSKWANEFELIHLKKDN